MEVMQTKEDFFMEVKKAKWLKFISAIAIFAVMIFCTGLNVHAEDVKDGILVTVSSDKENYNSEDEVKLKITVKNTNDFEVSDIKVENILPDGISLVSGDISKDSIHLQANEEATMDLTVKKADSGQADNTENTTNNAVPKGKSDTTSSPNSSPKTGENDTPLIAMIVMIISIVIMIICFWKGRKKHLKFLSLFVCLGVVGTFGITGITHAVSDNTQTEIINSSDENISSFTTEFSYMIDNVNYINKTTITYYTIDFYIFCDTEKKIAEIIDTDTFENANLEERKEIALNILKKLESENRIKKGSITFNEKSGQLFYEFIDGGEGSIFLEDFSDTEMGVSSNDKEYSEFDNTIFETIDEEYFMHDDTIFETITKYGYIGATSLTAVIVDNLGDGYDKEKALLKEESKAWTANKMTTDMKQDLTAEEMKTVLLPYDFSVIYLHGVYDKNNNTAMLAERTSFGDNFLHGIPVKNPFSKYYDDIKNGRIGTGTYEQGVCYYLTSDFFSYYYKGKLNGKIIWLSTCHGYENDVLVKSFSDCGAKTVIGATETVTARYCVFMVDAFVNKLLFGYSVKDALLFAKSQFGENDAIFEKKYYNKEDNTPAEFRIYNGGNETLVELVPVEVEEYGTLSGTVTDESGNPVRNAEVLAIPNRGNTYKAITDDNGRFIINDCPVDSYRIEVSAEGYELYQSDEFLSTDYVVLEGQEQKSVTIQLKKSKEYKEDDLKEKVISESNGNIVAWVYEDFDGNGTKEAFAVFDNGAEDSPKIQSIYFIDNKGNTKKMRNEFDYPAYDDSKYTICQGKGFFSVDVFGSGSAWKTYLFSVKDKNAYELDISGDLQGFYERNGYFYTLDNNHGNQALEYPEIELIYNSDTQQFTKDNRIISEENNKISDWKSAYIEVLSNLNYSSARFMTAYIDKDDIPELVVAYDSSHVAGCEIYTYYDDRVSKLEGNYTNGEFGSSGEILYLPHKNLFNSRYYGMGSNSDSLYRINNGNAQLECALQNNDYFTTVRVIEFKIDGIETNENEYWNKYNSYEIDSMTSINYANMIEVNSNNISNYFNNINGTELSRYTFSIDGTEFTAILFEEKWDGTSADLNYMITVFKGSSETNLSSIIVNYKHNTETDSSSTNILDYIEVFNNNLGIIEYKNSDMKIVSNYLWDSATNQFTFNGGNQIGGY